MNNEINSYDYRPRFSFFRTNREKESEKKLVVGFELEAEDINHTTEPEELAEGISEIINDGEKQFLYYKHDGSLDNGIEVVSMPFSLDYIRENKNKVEKNIKWYHPFKLIKRNKELEAIVEELFLIIDNYSDDLKEKTDELKETKSQIKSLEKIIKSMEQDKQSALNEVEVKPKRTRKSTKKEKEEPKKKTVTKKATTRRKTKKEE